MNLKNSPGISACSQLVLVCDDPHECLWPGRCVLPSHVRQDPAGGPTVKGQDGPASLRFCGAGTAIFRCPRLFVDRFSGGKEKSGQTGTKRGRTGRGGVDKRTVCDTIFKPKAMTKPSGPRRDEREGTVRALRDTDPRATSPAARDERDVSPRYGRNEMCRMCVAGIIRVVPRSLRFAPVNGGEALLFYPERGADSPRRIF